MSWLVFKEGLPVDGNVQLFTDNMITFASDCPFKLSGRCMPIWSPSKSALNAEHTSGCSWSDDFSVIFILKACIPILCNVGARFISTM